MINNIWILEGNIVEKEKIDEKEYYVIKNLCKNSEDLEEKKKIIKLVYLLKKIKLDSKQEKEFQNLLSKINFSKLDI